MADMPQADNLRLFEEASKKAKDRYDSAFIQYPGGSFDAVMRWFSPFWLYQSRRLGKIVSQGGRHPGLVRAYEDYYQDSEQGYIRWDGTRYLWDPTRNSWVGMIGGGRRRDNIVDLEALASRDWGNVLRRDKYADRHEGFFGQIEAFKETISPVGVYPGTMFNLAAAMPRGLAAAARTGLVSAGLEAAELGSELLFPMAETVLNAFEVAGQGHLTRPLRKVLVDPFHEYAIGNALADQYHRGEGGDIESMRRSAEQQVGVDSIIQAHLGNVKVKSQELTDEQRLYAEGLARLRGTTPEKIIELRRAGQLEPPDALENAALRQLTEDAYGEDMMRRRSTAIRPLKSARLRTIGDFA